MTYPLSERKFKIVRRLSDRKYRWNIGEFIAEGNSLVIEALQKPRDVRLVVVEEGSVDRSQAAMDIAEDKGVPVFIAKTRDFLEISTTVHSSGALAVVNRDNTKMRDWFFKRVQSGDDQPSLVFWFEGIQDPGNLGSIIRSAEAMGADAVVSGPGTVDILNPKVIRGAMGATFHFPVVTSAEISFGFTGFRNAGYTVASTIISPQAVDIWDYEPPKKLLLVLGNEGSGLSFNTIEDSDDLLTIPIAGRSESLSVAATGAILSAYLSSKMGILKK